MGERLGDAQCQEALEETAGHKCQGASGKRGYPSLSYPRNPTEGSARTCSLEPGGELGWGDLKPLSRHPSGQQAGLGPPGCTGQRLTLLVSESKGSGVGVLAFWASSGGGARTRGSPKGRAAAKFIRG